MQDNNRLSIATNIAAHYRSHQGYIGKYVKPILIQPLLLEVKQIIQSQLTFFVVSAMLTNIGKKV